MNRSKKVLVIINNLGIGGAERLVVDDINEMLRRGINVWLLTLKPEKEGKSLSSQCKISHDKWIKNDFGSLFNIKSWFKVVKEIKVFKPDVLITHLWYANTIGKIAGKIAGVKNIISFEHNIYDTLKTKKMFLVDKLLQRLSTHIIAVSEAVKKSLIRHGINENKIKVIHNGIDISKYSRLLQKDVRKELKLESNFIYIFIGRLIYQKGVDVLIKAFEKTKNSDLLIVGEGEKKGELMKLSNDLGIADKVHFLGTRQDIPDLLLSADCFVLSSRYEGLPMVLLEAVAACKAIIVSDFESATEIIKDGENGLIVPKEDVEQLAKAMNLVSEDLKLRNHLKEQIAKDSNNVSVEYHIDKLLTLLK